MKLDLEDQVAVVVGGAQGIGLATAQLFHAEGAKVAIWDRLAVGEEAQGEASSINPERWADFRVDVTDRELLSQACQATLQRFGRIDHWIHAAAVGSGKFGFPFTNLDADDWRQVLEVNIMGLTYTAHCLAPLLQSQRSGTITLVGSVAGQIGSQTDPPYSASKAANINFAQCLAKDLAADGVRVNIVHPGMVQTDLNRRVWRAWNDRQPLEQRRSYEAWAQEKIERWTPLGRWQTAEDIANLIVFLASPRAANITGQSLNVDGGWVMR